MWCIEELVACDKTAVTCADEIAAALTGENWEQWGIKHGHGLLVALGAGNANAVARGTRCGLTYGCGLGKAAHDAGSSDGELVVAANGLEKRRTD